jgi:hypothetical protein
MMAVVEDVLYLMLKAKHHSVLRLTDCLQLTGPSVTCKSLTRGCLQLLYCRATMGCIQDMLSCDL